MQEMTISKRPSIVLGVTLAILAAGLLQRVLLPTPLIFPATYVIAFGSLILIYSAGFYAKVEFEGLNILPNKPLFAIAFWLSLAIIIAVFALRNRLGAPALERDESWSHLIVGVLLYCFAASCVFGSSFTGFGFKLFLQNPFLWLRYLTMRARGQIPKEP